MPVSMIATLTGIPRPDRGADPPGARSAAAAD
jgi:hypothetical protein